MGDPFLTGSDLKRCFKYFDGVSRIAVAKYAKNAELYEILDIKSPVHERRVRNIVECQTVSGIPGAVHFGRS